MIQSGYVTLEQSPLIAFVKKHPSPPTIIAREETGRDEIMTGYRESVIQTFDTQVPSQTGWYMLIEVSHSKEIKYIYIGLSKNLKDRLIEEFGDGWIAPWVKIYGSHLTEIACQRYPRYTSGIRKDAQRANVSVANKTVE